jgi:hypothetical protein
MGSRTKLCFSLTALVWIELTEDADDVLSAGPKLSEDEDEEGASRSSCWSRTALASGKDCRIPPPVLIESGELAAKTGPG